jgi:REP element-mobilizing transposase RayT
MDPTTPTPTRATPAQGHGGKRDGAGRKKSGLRRHDPPHRRRPELSSRHPVHVVLRTTRHIDRLRCGDIYHAIRRVLPRYLGLPDFRIVHLSIQHNHLHLIVEAADRVRLARRMQSFGISAARAINRAHNIPRGQVFAYRYHATQIRTPRQARNTLAYVLNNWRRHREDLQTEQTRNAWLDPYSSALSFTGWSRRFAMPPGYLALPVSPPATALLKMRGLDPLARPGPMQWL